MTSEAQKASQKKFDAKNTRHYGFKFNKNTDGDIIEHLDNLENKQKYIKELIRADIQRNR